MRLLIVEDEADIAQMLGQFFSDRGYEVMIAEDGARALELAQRRVDIILLDVGLPDEDGFCICRRIRDFVGCPIVFLTARVEEEDKLRGFAYGGDDYVTKPFSLAELEARVGAHLRREERGRSSANVRFLGKLSIDYAARRVYAGDVCIPLARKEFDIVELLSQNAEQVFSRERIYERVWGWDAEGDSGVVAEHIRRIRRKLAAQGEEARIATVWGCGYQWKR
ncbi:MAG: response regulator transcription factor [Clostridia bacterium]|nr:response regulator transcription factor [Clostridia bacterium]